MVVLVGWPVVCCFAIKEKKHPLFFINLATWKPDPISGLADGVALAVGDPGDLACGGVGVKLIILEARHHLPFSL
jgi:hypothetical protein